MNVIGFDILKRQTKRQQEFDALRQRYRNLPTEEAEVDVNHGIPLVNHNNRQRTHHSRNYGAVSRKATYRNTTDS